ncbi:MAG: hypothetical protein ACLUEV_05135 [Alistipes sp.]
MMMIKPFAQQEEAGTAGLLAEFLQERGVEVHRKKNNVPRSTATTTRPNRPFCCSHHDTVKPNAPTRATRSQRPSRATGCGLGSNDAGASGVSSPQPLHFYDGKT